MKKKVCILLAAALALLLAAGLLGCGERQEETGTPEEENPYNTSIDAGELAEYLFNNITFADELAEVDDDIAYEIYGIDENAVKDISVYMSTGATAEEIAVFTVGDDEGALLVSAAMSARIEQQKSGFENYVPEEIPKLENAVITEIDSAVIMIVCNDTSETETAIEGYINTYLQ